MESVAQSKRDLRAVESSRFAESARPQDVSGQRRYGCRCAWLPLPRHHLCSARCRRYLSGSRSAPFGAVIRDAADGRYGARTPHAAGRTGLAAMSGSAIAWAAGGAALALLAVLLLLRRSRHGDVTCRWLAAVAVVWGAAFATQEAGTGDITPAVIQLTLTDLLALCGLPLLIVSQFRMAPPGIRRAGWVADGVLLALGVFAVGWIAVLRDAYAATGVGPGFFAVDLIHPVADLVVLAATLWPAVRAGRPGLLLYGALFAATVGDFLAVQARAGGMHPGTWPQLAWLAAICLLGSLGLAGTSPTRSRLPLATGLALTAAGAGGLVTLVFALVRWGPPLDRLPLAEPDSRRRD